MGLLPGLLCGVELRLHVLAGRIGLLANGVELSAQLPAGLQFPGQRVVSGRLCRHGGRSFQLGGVGRTARTLDGAISFGNIGSVLGLDGGNLITRIGDRGVGLVANTREFGGELVADPGRFCQGVLGDSVSLLTFTLSDPGPFLGQSSSPLGCRRPPLGLGNLGQRLTVGILDLSAGSLDVACDAASPSTPRRRSHAIRPASQANPRAAVQGGAGQRDRRGRRLVGSYHYRARAFCAACAPRIGAVVHQTGRIGLFAIERRPAGSRVRPAGPATARIVTLVLPARPAGAAPSVIAPMYRSFVSFVKRAT